MPQEEEVRQTIKEVEATVPALEKAELLHIVTAKKLRTNQRTKKPTVITNKVFTHKKNKLFQKTGYQKAFCVQFEFKLKWLENSLWLVYKRELESGLC